MKRFGQCAASAALHACVRPGPLIRDWIFEGSQIERKGIEFGEQS